MARKHLTTHSIAGNQTDADFSMWVVRIMDAQRCAACLQALTPSTIARVEHAVMALGRRAHGLHAQSVRAGDFMPSPSWIAFVRDRLSTNLFATCFIGLPEEGAPATSHPEMAAFESWCNAHPADLVCLARRMMALPDDDRSKRLAAVRFDDVDFDALGTNLLNERDAALALTPDEHEQEACKEAYFWGDKVLRHLGALVRDLASGAVEWNAMLVAYPQCAPAIELLRALPSDTADLQHVFNAAGSVREVLRKQSPQNERERRWEDRLTALQTACKMAGGKLTAELLLRIEPNLADARPAKDVPPADVKPPPTLSDLCQMWQLWNHEWCSCATVLTLLSNGHARQARDWAFLGFKNLATAIGPRCQPLDRDSAKLHAAGSLTPEALESARLEIMALKDCTAKPDDPERYKPASWFPSKLRDRIRMAAQSSRKTMRVASRTHDGVTLYCVDDVHRWWPHDFPKSA